MFVWCHLYNINNNWRCIHLRFLFISAASGAGAASGGEMSSWMMRDNLWQTACDQAGGEQETAAEAEDGGIGAPVQPTVAEHWPSHGRVKLVQKAVLETGCVS